MSGNVTSMRSDKDARNSTARAKGRAVRVVVLPDPALPFPEAEADAVELLLSRNRAAWKVLAADFGTLRMTRLIPDSTRGKIQEIVARIRRRDHSYRWPTFAEYLLVEAREGADGVALSRRLKEWSDVREAYPYAESEAPGVVIPRPTNQYDPHYQNQFYLRSAPEGVGVEDVWARLAGQSSQGADGSGLALVDMENGFNPDHEDLVAHFQGPGANPRDPIIGLNDLTEAHHGTAVLGAVCATNNRKGCCGIVPNLSHVALASTLSVHNGEFQELSRSAVLAEAVYFLRSWPGSVILIEHHLLGTPTAADGTPGIPYGTPVELQQQDYDAIKLACDAGCVVIEPAGNGGADLDHDVRPPSPDITHAPSGAIMVAASSVRNAGSPGSSGGATGICHLPLGTTSTRVTTVGSRIDCFAPGEGIWTCGATPDYSGGNDGVRFRNNEYRGDFGRTSAAAAIIAGVAVCVQGIVLGRYGVALKPERVLSLLKDPQLSTASENGLSDRIGVMPDLSKIEQSLRQMALLPQGWEFS